jgi:putative ATP-binding cassette transporter
VTLVSFITILWQLSGILHFTLWGHQLQLPGRMVWAALVYAVVGTWLTSGYGQIAVIYPFLVATPRYLSGEFTLGQLMQTASAFGQVQSALSFIVDAYSSIAEWRAVVQRLSGFQQNMSVIRGRPVTLQRSEVPAGAGPDVIVCDASVALPDGQPLLNDVRLTFGAAEKVLLSGPSGCGKSTLFRTLAGIWPFANGAIRRPAGARVLFLPQRHYLPLGSLRTVVCYPAAGTDFDDAALSAALSAVGLPELASKLDEVRLWAQQLSPGEQQRIAVARALLLKPDWLFLDEATAALDDTSEAQLYQLLGRELPGTTLISIAHRAQLARFHQRCIQFGSLAGAAMQEPVPIAAAGDA